MRSPHEKSPVRGTAEVKKAIAIGSTNEAWSSVAPITCYCLASILMTVVNKFVVSGAHFSMNFLLLCIQSAVCVACVVLVKKLGIISCRDFDRDDAKMWFPISCLLVAVIYTGSKSLQFLSIPVYTIFKNMTIILIAYGEVIWFSCRVTGPTLISFLLMILSAIIAAWADKKDGVSLITPTLQSSIPSSPLGAATGVVHHLGIGYLWMLVNCLATATYVLTMRKRIKTTGFSDWDTMFYNNVLSIPVLGLCSLIVEDWSSASLAHNFPPETRRFLLFVIAFSGAAAVGISYTTAWCVRTTSSTTYSMVGALNKLPVAASGMLFFGDPVTFQSVLAIAVGFFAGVVYAIAKNNQKRSENRIQTDVVLPLSNRKV